MKEIFIFAVIVIVVSFVYIVKQWLDYKKVAVQTKEYTKVVALTWLLVALMAVMGITSLSEQLRNYLFSLIGMETPAYFVWMTFAGYVIFAAAVVFIINKEKPDDTASQIKVEQGVGVVQAAEVHVTQNFHTPEEKLIEDESAKIPQKTQTSKLPQTSSKLFGREDELKELDKAWNNPHTNVFILKAMGGAGKTALIQKWIDDLSADRFHRAERVYAWSFYSQGASEDKQASSDLFFDAIFDWFEYEGKNPGSAHDKGVKLAELAREHHTLLILDGLEPLQYPFGGAMNGELRDAGIKALTKELAVQNNGLLLISSRQDIVEIADKPMVVSHPLKPLSLEASIQLFGANGIKGTVQEFRDTVEEYQGHALSLSLLTKYLKIYEEGDIRKRDHMTELTAFPEEDRESKHAFNVMAGYEKQLEDTVDLKILLMLGLFDRPASAGAIEALRKAEIEHLSDVAVKGNMVFKAAIMRLREQGLLNKGNPDHLDTLDAHPLVREYFAVRFEQTYSSAWQQAHGTLYTYFKNLPEKEQPDTLNEMEPLFAAVAHGCAVGLHQEAYDEVYLPRIQRGIEYYLTRKLGAFGADLSVLSHFFDKSSQSLSPLLHPSGWQILAAELTDPASETLSLSIAANDLRALGRLSEAVQPMQAGLKLEMSQKDWRNASITASSLSELQLIRGQIFPSNADSDTQSALEAAELSVKLANSIWLLKTGRSRSANVWHQAGNLTTAHKLFVRAEELQEVSEPMHSLLYSLSGFQYCDLLLTAGEWREVQQRARQTLEWVTNAGRDILSPSLDKLSLGRTSLQQVVDVAEINENAPADMAPDYQFLKVKILDVSTIKESEALNEALQTSKKWLNEAVDSLRKAGQEQYLPQGLLARASYHRWTLSFAFDDANMELALRDLQEVQEIAERGGMRLFLCDYHLESARLGLTLEPAIEVSNISVEKHIAEARKIIDQTEYGRRLPELEYLEEVFRR